jgi:putative pyruvate formate lyase activating enzyme
VTPAELARIMLYLQGMGCHNINFVTPSHVVAQILEALPYAIAEGLRLPLVYNTGCYDALETIRLLEGVIDIYMPDFKFWDPEVAGRLAEAPDYPEVARKAIKEMHLQVGDLQLDEDGIALRGLLVRHLVMPEGLAGTPQIVRFLASLSKRTYINIMGQYYPAGEAYRYPELSRRISRKEFLAAYQAAKDAGLHRFAD